MQRSPTAIAAAGVALTPVAALLDYVTGPELASVTFYLVPVSLVGWGGARSHGILVACVASAAWAVAEATKGRSYESSWVFLWNSLTRLVVFLTIALLLHRARTVAADAPVEATGAPCPHCGSTDTLALHAGLVCRSCKRLSDAPG